MANDTYKHCYFVSYSYRDKDGYSGNGYANIRRQDKISSFEDLEGMAESIKKENEFLKVIIINFKELEATPTEDEVKVVRCKKCRYFFDDCCNHSKNRVAYRVPDFGKHYVYKDGIKVEPDHFCGYGERKKGAEK